MNSAGQIVGQLFGCCGFDCGDVCDAASNSTVDGALAYYYDQIEEFLDPSPCVPFAEVCDNDVDDDCDGLADCDDDDCDEDPACEVGGCTVGVNKEPCDAPSDCCSGNCKRGICRGN